VCELSIAAIGSSKLVESFSIIGARTVIVDDPKSEEGLAKVMEAIANYKTVIIEEEVYSNVKEKLESVLSGMRYPPLIVVVPDLKNRGTSRLKDLHELLSVAVGVRLKWPR